ncbi:hypothetical protein [Serratia odorifera]|uniref:Gram-negative pili assembly chaperone domain protein n=2 Tax=Serratia odorifera TaxID=618 RepID=D4E4E9_SEROD|nr:hypothetical protein [Serratia odorifera]EFE95358.1 hypothetical protein HMPREF0758_3049 [Serratia odorifera DSM 4582]PNK90030.1 hypothetical protein CEQ31_010090 [Serratia odorifera]RII71095.1 hypothetical protein DX901_16230 [Serratia odorifera]VDZ61211.1 putative fimbrial protein TcfA [Serratia odorifera]HEJ9094299.1 hypothetical protein [Serratia odorifera]
MFKGIFTAAALMVALPALAGPVINVGSLNEYMQSGKSTLAKRIHNTGDATAFVRINIYEILFDNKGETVEKNLDADAMVSGKGTGLLSTPPRLIIPAGGMQTNRLVFTGSREKERYYRVRYIPVVPDSSKEFGISSADAKQYQDEINAGVTVMSGFGTIVTVHPDNARFDSRISGGGNQLNIVNHGNASVVIDGLKSCDKALKNCDSGVIVQLRPGKTLKRTAAPDRVWQYTLIEGGQKKNLNTGK